MTHRPPAARGFGLPGRYLWDPWPVQHADGGTVRLGEQELWVALTTTDACHPDDRHDHPRQHLLLLGDELIDLGPLFPEGCAPGSREWSGSTIYDPVQETLTAYYTAAGRRSEHPITHEQRLFVAAGTVDRSTGFAVTSWGPHRELVAPQPPYLPSGYTPAAPERWLHAFRDPGWFRDPTTGQGHLLIACSVDDADGTGPWGAVGLARAGDDGWRLQPPILTSIGWNRELERPHIIWRHGRFYLFVSTQQHTFARPEHGRTGLYGYVAEAIEGPYTPVNGDGLILANPPDRPHYAYAWIVLDDLRVGAFLNYPHEPAGAPRPGKEAAFAGGFAPFHRLMLQGDQVLVEPDLGTTTA